MRLLTILTMIVAFPLVAFPATIHVPADQPTIQAGIIAAVNGDTVLVAPGTYGENINFIGKAITVTSELGRRFTTIDGNQAGSVVQCHSGEGDTSVLEGFTITNGTGTPSHTGPVGGGMYNLSSNPTVSSCTFTGNTAALSQGGGMYNSASSPTVIKCEFFENSAGHGGGMYNEGSPMVRDCTFRGNTASIYGGGMYNLYSSNPSLINCEFIENAAFEGGGLCNRIDCSPILANCTFIRNEANDGGGMFNYSSSPTVTSSTFFGNRADSEGGGLFNWETPSPTVTNCILWNDTPHEIFNNNSTPTVTYCCVEGSYPGNGNISSDPLFVDSVNSDFHITLPSPCRDSGNFTAVLHPEDFEGNKRIAYGSLDMGADEHFDHMYITGDTVPSGTIQVKFTALSGAWVFAIIVGVNIFDPPLPSDYGMWYMDNPMQILRGVWTLPASGNLAFSGTLPAVPSGPYTIYLQGVLNYKLTNLGVVEVE